LERPAVRPSEPRDKGRTNAVRTQILSIAAVLGLAAGSAAAGSGPGLALKIGAQTLESPLSGQDTTRTRYELELSTAKMGGDHIDFALMFGGSSLGTLSDEIAYWDEDVFVEESYRDDLSILDLRLAARLYPLGDNDTIQPYVGAGFGYFWLLDDWEDRYAETIEDPLFPGSFITFEACESDTETLADGLFGFVLAGFNVTLRENLELLFEFQYDFEKDDSGFDLGGPIYMAGARFRF
jgi:hypothetical protein